MAIADLKNVLKIFGGSDIGDDERNRLYKEVLLMTLSRAADADIHIHQLEVERIVEILKQHTGEDFSTGDVRVAARDELYAQASLRKYLNSVRDKMRNEDRVDTIRALADVFRIDKEVLLSRSRRKAVYYPRQVAMYLCRQHTDATLTAIGKAFGRDHASVIHSLAVIHRKCQSDAVTRHKVAFLADQIFKGCHPRGPTA